jgi:Transposase DDE domain
MGCLLDALEHAYRVLGFARATGGDEVFAQLVLARIIEPASKLDSLRVLEEAGVTAASYRTVTRRLRAFAEDSWRQRISAACAAHAGLGPASLVLYDVSTLYFETDAGDGFRESGFSKERRLEPQITIGLLTDAGGFPLTVSAFEGNKAETKTMLPVIKSFMAAHHLPDVTIVADAGMVSEANQKDIEAAGLSFILGMKIPHVPYVVAQWRREHPGEQIPDGHVFTQPWPAGPKAERRDQVIYYQYGKTGPGAPCAASTSRSPRPATPSPGRPLSSATGSSSSARAPPPSTGNWRPKPGHWPASRATSPTCRAAPTAPRSPRSS